MAKLIGPLQSFSASGKLADSIVYFGWKGIACVRQLVIPANPQSEGQGNIRTIIGGIGRGVGKVEVDSAYSDQLLTLEAIPAQQTRQSYLVKYIKDNYFASEGATLKSNYATTLKELTGHTSYTTFQGAGDTLGILAFGLSYDDIADFDKGLAIYLVAKTAIALGFTGSPYTKTLASWTATQIDKLVAHVQA